tara:strand:- start:176 stop:304 length:129 start_codon:yes stop_codon:yes gene_type:complete
MLQETMPELLQHDLQNLQGVTEDLATIVGDRPTLFVLLRHFG